MPRKMQKKNNKDPVLTREIPLSPWTLLELDLFILDDHSFLLIVDFYIKNFPVVRNPQQLDIQICYQCTKGHLL